MALNGILKSLTTQTDEIEKQYENANMDNFSEFTLVIARIGPIFKQAEVFAHLLDGGTKESYPERLFLEQHFPHIVFPKLDEVKQLDKQLTTFCERVFELSGKINSHGFAHASSKNDDTLLPSFTLQLLSLYLKEIKAEELGTQDGVMPVVSDYIRKAKEAREQQAESSSSSEPNTNSKNTYTPL